MASEQDQIDELFRFLSADTDQTSTSSKRNSVDANSMAKLFSLVQGEAIDSSPGLLVEDLLDSDERSLVTDLNQRFEELCETLLGLKVSSFAQTHAQTLVNLESYLAYAQIEIAKIEPIEQKDPLPSSEAAIDESLDQRIPQPPDATLEQVEPSAGRVITPTSRGHSYFKHIKVRHVLLGLAAIALPLTLKFGIPAVLSNRRVEPLLDSSNSAMAQVLSFDGETLIVEQPGRPPESMHLAALSPLEPHWQAEANKVFSLLLEANKGKVSVVPVAPLSSPTNLALIELPNGTTLQEVLLSNGIAKLNQNGLDAVPSDVATTLQEAQATAQAQHKNIWSEDAANGTP